MKGVNNIERVQAAMVAMEGNALTWTNGGNCVLKMLIGRILKLQ